MPPKKAKIATLSPGGCTTYGRIPTPGANEDEEDEHAKKQRAASNRQSLGRARKAAGRAAPGRRTDATFEERPTPTRGVNRYQHELSPSAGSSPRSRAQRAERRKNRVMVVRAAAARARIEEDLYRAEANGERDQAVKRARSASAVAAAAASSSLSAVRNTSIGASSESQKARIRRFQRDIGPLLDMDTLCWQQNDAVKSAVLGGDSDMDFSLQLIESLFVHADSPANARIFFGTLFVIVGAYGEIITKHSPRDGPVLARLFEETVILFRAHSSDESVVRSALFTISSLFDPCDEPYSGDVADDATRNLNYFGLGPLVIDALDRYGANECIQHWGWSCTDGLLDFTDARERIACPKLFPLICRSIQRLVGDGVVGESDEDTVLCHICQVVLKLTHAWEQLKHAGVHDAIRIARDSIIDTQANTPEEEKYLVYVWFDHAAEDALHWLDLEERYMNSLGSFESWRRAKWFTDEGFDSGKPWYGKKPRNGERGRQREGHYVS